MIPVQQQTFTVPAGGSFPLQCNGRYFRIQSATGALKVVADTFGNMGLVGVGQGLRLRGHDPAFQRLTFVDTSGQPNIVTVVVADADFVDNSLLGVVSVVDGGKTRTLAGNVYTGGLLKTPVAGQYAHIQLRNESGTFRLVVSQITVQAFNGDSLSIYPQKATLATAVAFMRNKRLNLADSVVSRIYTDSLAAPISGGIPIFGASLFTSSSYTYKLTEPVVVPPLGTLTVVGSNASNTLGASFELYEELDA